MKHLFSPKVYKILFISLFLLLAVKLIWLAVEMFWLSSVGIDHEEETGNKSLYYRVKMTPNESHVPVQVPKKVVKIAGSIKDIHLLAVYNASDLTVVTVEHKKKTKVLGLGDKINGFVLSGGGPRYATFTKEGKTYKIELTKNKRSSLLGSSIKPSVKVRRPHRKAPEPQKVEGEIVDAGDHRIIDRSLLDHYAGNMDDIFKNIGIVELKKGNKTTGFRVTFVKRGSPFAKLGLRRGDILKSINGEELNSYNAAFSAYKNIKDAENLTLVVIRGKKEMELEYEIN